jgi:hypothetical protein
MRVEDSYTVRPELIHPLMALYQYESRVLNNGLNIGRSFSIEWTLEDLIEIVTEAECSEDSAIQLLQELDNTNRLVKFFSDDGSVRAYRTDTAELVRLSTFNYNRYPEKKTDKMISTQSGVTWAIESKMTPKWSISISEAASQLQSELANGWIDDNGEMHYYRNSELNQAITIVAGAYNAVQRRKFGKDGMLSGFQFRSARAMLRGMYSDGDKTLAILAGTGSGKSYGFQIGSLIAIVEQRLANTLTKTHSIFLYPRVALMDDQRDTMEELLEACNKMLKGKEIRWVTDGGSNLKKDYRLKIDQGISEKKLEKLSAPELIKSFYGSEHQCPHLVFANADTITNRLTSYFAIEGLTSQLQNVVFDEIHLLESITGANTAGVIRRLCAHAGRELMLTGSSATIADEQGHLGKVFARKSSKVVVVKPDDDETELTGIIHHVLHKGLEGSSFKTNLVNLTSLVSHQRRRRITEEVIDPSKSHKTIGFADSLNLIGSWEFMLRDNEGLEFRGKVMKKIRSGGDASELYPESMPLPYRFDKPLIHLSSVEESISLETATQHCNSCIAGENSTLEVEDSSIFSKLPLDHFRPKKYGILEPLYEGPKVIGVTDNCPYFECGACWREELDYNPLALYNEGPIIYNNSIRPIRLTSQSIQDKKQNITLGDELQHFSIELDDYHNVKAIIANQGKSIKDNSQIADIALSSPAIEVGMDFDNALDSVMFKAIRNVSAYRQKVGRLGRERFRDVYSSMLISFRAVDYHYYRNPAPLLSSDIKDIIALNVDNENVRKQICYMAVFDDIAKNGGTVARNLHNIRVWGKYSDVVFEAITYLSSNYQKIAKRLKSGLSEPEISICKSAIDKVLEHLNLLLDDISPLLQGDSKCLADRIGKKNAIFNSNYSSGMQNLLLSAEGNSFRNIAKNFDNYLKNIALNRHFDDNSVEVVTTGINLAVEMWDNFEKGKDDNRLGMFIEEYIEPLAMNGYSIPNLNIIFMSGLQEKAALENKSDYVKSLISKGRIPLARSLTDWTVERKKGRKQFSIWYLRDLLSALHFTKHDLPFVFQKTLFKPPNEKTVAVYVPKPNTGNPEDSKGDTIDLPLHEILFAHAPGMWNYRRASMPMKTSCYKQLQPSDNHTHMNLPLNNIAGEDTIKHQYIKRSKISDDDLPWNFNVNNFSNSIDLYEPEKIQLRMSRGLKNGNEVIKGNCYNDNYVLIKDDDDTDEENFSQDDGELDDDNSEKEKNNINVPDCYPIGWRSIGKVKSQPLTSFSGPFSVEFEKDILRKLLFDDDEFCNSTHAKEYILGNTRKYQGGGELEIQYVDNKVSNNNAVIGHEFNTQGIRFVVSRNTLKLSAEWTLEQMKSRDGSHTTYQVLQYLLSKNLKINRFVVDSLLRLTLHKLENVIPDSLNSWLECISGLKFIDFGNFKEEWEGTSLRAINLDSLQCIVEEIVANPSSVTENKLQLIEDWSVRTYSNSIAIHMLQAAREFSGSRDDDLGYHVECKSGINDCNSEVVIWLYDRTPDGNGSCDTLQKWMQIPKIVKEEFEQLNQRTLPSKDYIDCLEGSYLVPCSAHQSDVIAYACHQNNIDPKQLRHGLSREFIFSHDNYAGYWQRLDERGYSRKDFPFVKLIIPFLYRDLSEQEFFRKSVDGCHSSCVECLQEFGISMFGPLDGPNFANKRMISHVISELMKGNPDDYRQTAVSISGAASGIEGLGSFDPTKPLEVEINGNIEQRFAMLHPVRMWSEIDTDNPFGQHGQIQSKFWTKMKIDRWSNGSGK